MTQTREIEVKYRVLDSLGVELERTTDTYDSLVRAALASA